jgi:aspartate aminotransferase
MTEQHSESSVQLASRTAAPPSAIRQIFAQIPRLNAKRSVEGRSSIIDLSIGQPHLPPNPAVTYALQHAFATPDLHLGYSSAAGHDETRDAICSLYQHYYPNLRWQRSEVMVCNGASQALWNAFGIFIEKKADTVLTFAPYFSTYRGQIAAWGGTLKTILPRDAHARPDINALNEALQDDPQVKVILLNYPNNPSGVSLTVEETTRLAAVLKAYPHVAIVLDDVYQDLNFLETPRLLELAPELKSRSILLHSGAKTLAGAPDLRVGMAAAPAAWIDAMTQLQLFETAGVAYPTQCALRAAIVDYLKHPIGHPWLISIRETYQQNMACMVEALRGNGFPDLMPAEGAFYLWLSAKAYFGKAKGDRVITDDLTWVQYLLEDAGVATVPGSGFGMPKEAGCFRIATTKAPQQLQLAARQIGDAVRALS